MLGAATPSQVIIQLWRHTLLSLLLQHLGLHLPPATLWKVTLTWRPSQEKTKASYRSSSWGGGEAPGRQLVS